MVVFVCVFKFASMFIGGLFCLLLPNTYFVFTFSSSYQNYESYCYAVAYLCAYIHTCTTVSAYTAVIITATVLLFTFPWPYDFQAMFILFAVPTCLFTLSFTTFTGNQYGDG